MLRSISRLVPEGLSVDAIRHVGRHVVVTTRSRLSASACPACGCASSRVHSRYRRLVADLPSHGHEVTIEISVRRFRCVEVSCRRRIFAERVGRSRRIPVRSPHRASRRHRAPLRAGARRPAGCQARPSTDASSQSGHAAANCPPTHGRSRSAGSAESGDRRLGLAQGDELRHAGLRPRPASHRRSPARSRARHRCRLARVPSRIGDRRTRSRRQLRAGCRARCLAGASRWRTAGTSWRTPARPFSPPCAGSMTTIRKVVGATIVDVALLTSAERPAVRWLLQAPGGGRGHPYVGSRRYGDQGDRAADGSEPQPCSRRPARRRPGRRVPVPRDDPRPLPRRARCRVGSGLPSAAPNCGAGCEGSAFPDRCGS